jgi:hypothetical protein
MAFDHIGGAEPSTLTFKLRTVSQTINSSKMHAEIMHLGDQTSSLAVAMVTSGAAPSTAFGLVVRAAGTVEVTGPAAVGLALETGNLATIAGAIRVEDAAFASGQAGMSVLVVREDTPVITAADQDYVNLKSDPVGRLWVNASGAIVTVTDGGTPINVQVTSLPDVAISAGTIDVVSSVGGVVAIKGNSTVHQGTSPWVIGGNSTVAPLAGSAWVVRSSAADFNANISGNCTVAPLAGSTWMVRPVQSSAADLQVTCTPVAGSTWSVRPIQSSKADLLVTVYQSSKADFLNTVYQSSAADLNVTVAGYSTVVLISGNSTVFQGGSWSVSNISPQSSVAPSSGSSGLVVRQVIDGITTFASTSVLATTSASVISSVAGVRAYITAYTITSTNQTPAHWGFFSSNATLLWPMILAAISSGVSGANLAVSPPGYLFRTAVAEALNFKTVGSTVAGVQMGVSYYQAP